MEVTNPKLSSVKKNYHLEMKFNGKKFEFDTNDLNTAIQSVKPNFLKTNILFSCKNYKNQTCNKVVLVSRAKMMWKNPTYLNMFINQLIFKDNG